MAAQESPVRINPTLLSQAQAAAESFHRSIPEQLAYWAELGRLVEARLTSEDISYLKSGLASVSVSVPSSSSQDHAFRMPVDIVSLAMQSQGSSETDQARQLIKSRCGLRYQSSKKYPGYLEEVSADGAVVVGSFKGGKFKKAKKVPG